jgi:NAD+ synthase
MSRQSVMERIPQELRMTDAAGEVDRIVAWLKAHLASQGLKRVVLGLSGGIDSAVAAALAIRALGAENVRMIAMPYGLTDDGGSFSASTRESLEHAQLFASQFWNAELLVQDIAGTVKAEVLGSGLEAEFRASPDDPRLHLHLGNIKARVRAVRLRGHANRMGDALVMGTENMTENLLGYFTIGGDEESDIEVLSGYLKSEVRQLALAMEEVPMAITAKAPSADLWSGQTDEGELGFSYADADRVLSVAVSTGAIATADWSRLQVPGVDADVVRRVAARVQATQFKRDPKPTYPAPRLAALAA